MGTPSTHHLNFIPSPADLLNLLKSLAILEAILCEDWSYRYFTFQDKWDDQASCGIMRNGEGDQLYVLFSPHGVVINGFAHESKMNGWRSLPGAANNNLFQKIFSSKKDHTNTLHQMIWDGVIEELPKVFRPFIFGEPIKSIGTTFCIWHEKENASWQIGSSINFPDDQYGDGSKDLLELLDGQPNTFKRWAEEYHAEFLNGHEIALEDLEAVYTNQSLNQALVQKINPSIAHWNQLKMDLKQIGVDCPW